MVGLLNTFGKGILYVIGLPFFIAALLLFGVFGLFAFIFQLIRSIIFFFTGQKFFPELPEDKQLRLLQEGANPNSSEEAVPEEATPTQIEKEKPIIYEYIEEPMAEEPVPEEEILSRVSRAETVEEACFGKETPNEPVEEPVEKPILEETEEIEEDEVIQDSFGLQEEQEVEVEEEIENNDIQGEEEAEQDVVETSSEEQEEETQDEELEVYVPKSSTYSDDFFDDDTEDDDGGVDIRFDV